MAFSLDSIFTTRTALPRGCGIIEIPPTAELRPFIRCFWTYDCGLGSHFFRIIPDCCADIIIPLDGTPAFFVGASDNSFITQKTGDVFGIRLYAWTVAYFLHINLFDTFNNAIPVNTILKNFDELQLQIIDEHDNTCRVDCAQNYLMRLYNGKICADVMNGIYHAISSDCRVTVKDLSDYCAVSKRTFERRFIDYTGIPPKTLINLLRYQLLWQTITQSDFSAADSAFKFGYYDEAHLYNSFKQYHGIGFKQARQEYLKLSHFYNILT